MNVHLAAPLKPAAFTAPIEIRPALPADAEAAGRIVYHAFGDFYRSRGFPMDFPSVDVAIDLVSSLIANPTIFGLVAARDGEIVGSNFLTEGDPIRGVGPISVHSEHQNEGIGRLLMQAVIDRGSGAIGVRLVQDAFNTKTMALYTQLGFDPREPLAVLSGLPRGRLPAEFRVRRMEREDLGEAAALYKRVHGYARTADLQTALAEAAPVVLERSGRITAYMAAPTLWLFNHAVGDTESDLRAVIRGAAELERSGPISFLLPIRQAALFRWCLDQGMQVVKPMTLMSRGHYAEPVGAWLPSVMY